MLVRLKIQGAQESADVPRVNICDAAVMCMMVSLLGGVYRNVDKDPDDIFSASLLQRAFPCIQIGGKETKERMCARIQQITLDKERATGNNDCGSM